ncbi:hypothetical protein GGS23DRAFT_446086 [Durotheca rogersii]|uniref:uncharacterized protein n=1 Tax=Durotheca rogersii TaxID=419775 RepID=UPI00221EB261|nr:uncharacterized protein GGS23DRAFT_446086 [Durotheca rogersii]KAI5855075.1 hypothetical protein GGS23DRAFT_446086 [Durotheca rogersii]
MPRRDLGLLIFSRSAVHFVNPGCVRAIPSRPKADNTMISLVRQLCWTLRAPTLSRRYRDAGIGFAFIALNQLFILPTQIILDIHSVSFPASILVMLLFTVILLVANCVYGETARFYSAHIRGPTDFLGRHMSFGFVASFIMLNRDHVSNAVDIPIVAGAFVVTTIAGYAGSFLLSWGTFQLESRFRGRQIRIHDHESENKAQPSPSIAWPAPLDGSRKFLWKLLRISAVMARGKSLASIGPAKRGFVSQFMVHLLNTPPLWICALLILAIGLPVYFTTKYETPFESLFFVLFWVMSVQFQRSLRSSHGLAPFPRVRSTLVIFANPVLVTSGFGTAYLWIKTSCTGQTIDDVVTQFRRHNSLAEGVLDIVKGRNSFADHIGTGDLAGTVLDAGIVCMSFKMFEYRRELWQTCITVFTTCAIMAAFNVFLNVLIAHGLGLQEADAVAFAARSVTIALAAPAVQNLDGSTTLMTALVIFGGIIFQMVADWLFSLLRIQDQGGQHLQLDSSKDSGKMEPAGEEREPARQRLRTEGNRVIAAGVTVGINAAAMGTAYLIERNSRATAYSALSMTVFGAITVALTTLPGVSEVIGSLAST